VADVILVAAMMGHESMTTTLGYRTVDAWRAGEVVTGMYGRAA